MIKCLRRWQRLLSGIFIHSLSLLLLLCVFESCEQPANKQLKISKKDSQSSSAASIPAQDVNHQEADINVRFVNVTEQAGITFRQMGGNFQEGFLPMEKGSGVAFGDYDDDGNLDFYIVNIPTLDSPEVSPNALYHNDGDGTFTDIAETAGVADVGFGMGCVFGDYDNDGNLDLYVTNYGANILYRNNGDGTFTDVTKSAGVGGEGVSTGAAFDAFSMGTAFADYDNDGFLDLYVANYIDYSKNPPDKRPVFPYNFIGGTNVLYRNNGDGTFSDVTFAARVDNGFHLSLGVTFGDFDNDGDADLYIANDTDQNINLPFHCRFARLT